MKKRYTLETSDWTWEAVVEIDHSHPSVEADIKMMVEFWMDAEDRLREHKGDYTRAFLAHLGEKLAFLSLNGDDVAWLITELGGYEGWVPLDGSHGITIISCDAFVFADIVITERKAA